MRKRRESQSKIPSISLIFLLMLAMARQSEPKTLQPCEAVRELQRAGVSRTMISNWVCLMQSESGMDTRLITGPKTAASYSFGVFQINSLKWCTRGRKGGTCMQRCEDFADDNIQDDIACAMKIYKANGFKGWDGWLKKCKGKPLPNIGQCKRR